MFQTNIGSRKQFTEWPDFDVLMEYLHQPTSLRLTSKGQKKVVMSIGGRSFDTMSISRR
jgi:hypothetical protein